MKFGKYGAVALTIVVMCIGIAMASISMATPSCTTPPPMPSLATFSWATARQTWLGIVTKCGGPQSYALFKQYVAPVDPKCQHNLAHTFGDALFDAEGIEALPVCDVSFAMGCFHGFFGRAIQLSGIGIIKDLESSCYRDLSTVPARVCVHGIGHGLLNLAGYTPDGITRALTECDALVARPESAHDCAGGIFMEYNTNMLTDLVPRPMPASPAVPCDSARADVQGICYFWSAQWWPDVLPHDAKYPMSTFVQAGALCRTYAGNHLRDCFEGLGRVTGPAAKFDETLSGTLCDAAAGNDSTADLYCRAYTAARFYFAFYASARALSLCAPFTGDDKRVCEDFAQHNYNGNGPGPLQAP